MLVYRVKKNDSILSIAKKFNTTASKIKQLNNVETVVEGERLVIEETGGSYVVGKAKDSSSRKRAEATLSVLLKRLKAFQKNLASALNSLKCSTEKPCF